MVGAVGTSPVTYPAQTSPSSSNDQTKNNSEPKSTTIIGKSSTSQKSGMSERDLKRLGMMECQSCKNRKYVDGSDDPGVSFKTPASISPEASAAAVKGHEGEHVSREQAKASSEGREVVSQTVTLHNGICPECGKVYVAGGTTTTVTRGKSPTSDVGSLLDQYA